MAKTEATDYLGMTGKLKTKQRQAVAGLVALLEEVTGWTGEPQKCIRVHGSYTRCLNADVTRPKPFDLYRIDEIDFAYDSGGSSYMASVPEHMGFIAACEKYLEEFHTKPYRPAGWESDIDEKADAEWRVRELWEAEETGRPPETEEPDGEA